MTDAPTFCFPLGKTPPPGSYRFELDVKWDGNAFYLERPSLTPWTLTSPTPISIWEARESVERATPLWIPLVIALGVVAYSFYDFVLRKR